MYHLSFSVHEMLLLIISNNGSTMLKDQISLVSVHVPVPARETQAILIFLWITWIWHMYGLLMVTTPHHKGIFRVYMKVTLTMLTDLPTFSSCEPAIWPKIWKSLVHSTKFWSDVWVLFKTEFQGDCQSKGTHRRNMCTPKMKTWFNWTLLRQSAKFARSDCTFCGCIILSTLTNHRSTRPSLSRLESSMDIVHQEVSQSSL